MKYDSYNEENDLFLYRPKELYAELGQVDELDVFGMSPYGDASIIEKINSVCLMPQKCLKPLKNTDFMAAI